MQSDNVPEPEASRFLCFGNSGVGECSKLKNLNGEKLSKVPSGLNYS